MAGVHIMSLLVLAFAGPGSAYSKIMPGLELVISQQMLELAAKAALPVMMKSLSVPICKDPCQFSGFSVTESNVSFPGKPEFAVAIVAPDKVSISFTNMEILLSPFTVSCWVGTSHGQATATGASLQFSLVPLATESGAIQVSIDDFHLTLPHFNFEMDNFFVTQMLNGVVGFANWISGFVMNPVTLKQFINGYMNVALWRASYKLPIKGPVPFNQDYIDFHIANADVVAQSSDTAYLRVGMAGAVYSESIVPVPQTPAPLPDLSQHELLAHMVLLEMGNFTFDTALYTFYDQHALTYDVNRSSLPQLLQGFLTTDFYKLFLPSLYTKYPGAAMVVRVSASSEGERPKVSIMPGGNKLVGDTDFAFYVETAMQDPAFVLTCPLDLAWNLSVNATRGPFKIVPEVLKTNMCHLRERSTNFEILGPALLAIMNNAILALFENYLLFILNTFLSTGFEIPPIVYNTPTGKLSLFLEDAVCNLRGGTAVVGFDIRAEQAASGRAFSSEEGEVMGQVLI